MINGLILCVDWMTAFTGFPVVKFNPVDNSLTEIGPDLGIGGGNWMCGVLANNGCI